MKSCKIGDIVAFYTKTCNKDCFITEGVVEKVYKTTVAGRVPDTLVARVLLQKRQKYTKVYKNRRTTTISVSKLHLVKK
jgi:hypothetical protein